MRTADSEPWKNSLRSDLTAALNLRRGWVRARAMEVIIKFETRPGHSVAVYDDEKDNFRDDDFVLK